jgi:glyoxylase-like metal-dependent hydrolase (beta-lactamase superfamily II)
MKPSATPLRLGRLKIHALEGGIQRLDGGAMFGVVPKTLWSRRAPADEKNRITLGMRCLLVEHDDGLVLIETGLGNKESQKFLEIYGIENHGLNGRTTLEHSLGLAGYRPQDVKTVIDSHLHFDHAGGNTFIAPDDAERRVQLTFPNAEYVMHRGEYEWATHTNERTAASYFPHNFEPVVAAGKVRFVEGSAPSILPGISGLVTPGHTPNHMAIIIESDGERLVYPADLIPTAAHLPLPWIMGYDVEPLRTLETKRAFYARGINENWRLAFVHDPTIVAARLVMGEKGVALAEIASLEIAERHDMDR